MSDIGALELLSKLVQFKSISSESNLDISDYISHFAVRHGGVVNRFRSSDGRKESLLLSFGPNVPGGIVLSGHMDVVPVDQRWTFDPFLLREADDKLFARGAVDMKGFLAIALTAATSVHPTRLSRPVYVALSYDEEVSCAGVQPIVAFLRSQVPTPAAVVVGEPTEMRLVAAHKGALDWLVRVKGRAAHSSLPHLGANAIHAAARIIGKVDEIAEGFKNAPSASPDLFDVPFTTLSVGVINGGVAFNVIAPDCEFRLEARIMEVGQDREIADQVTNFADQVVLPRLQATAPEATIEIVEQFGIPPLVREPGSVAERLIGRQLGTDQVEGVSYATEAGYFQEAGIPTVVFGPGSIAQAHQPDEFITLDQFESGRTFFEELVAAHAS
jgi:acetylornithine deacetylase